MNCMIEHYNYVKITLMKEGIGVTQTNLFFK
jgi:hypothetical protein